MPAVLCVPCLLCTVLCLLYTVPCARYTQCRARCTLTGPCLWHTHSSVPLADTLSVPVILCSVHGVQWSLHVIDTLIRTRYTLFFTQCTPFRACADCSVPVIHSPPCTMHPVPCLWDTFPCPICSVPCPICSVPCPMCSVPCPLDTVPCPDLKNMHIAHMDGWVGKGGGGSS